jgi:pyrimidine-nucleoside phosphorylase/thymidine phosphorylase
MTRAIDVVRKKRDGEELSPAEIRWMVEGIARGDVASYQWSALLMAIYMKGMTEAETVSLTEAMMHSGAVIDLSSIPGPKIDKHSTGGVGDKTSLILAPIAAAAGILVPMVSGRGLGHTGGTLDKLESIPGFRVDLDLNGYREVLAQCGLVLIGQTAEIAPADRFLYALRDATATVESAALITASIMSKKLAEGIDGLVLDVKFGDGAFLQVENESLELARTMCKIGKSMGKKVTALVTRMDQPLGRAAGNAVEVAESIACLRGEGPSDLMELSIGLAAEMIVLGGRTGDIAEARALCHAVVKSGQALARFRSLIAAQGGDPRVVDDPSLLPAPRRRMDIPAPSSGTVQRLGARKIGQATMLLGAGRARVDSTIDPAVGIILHKKIGDAVDEGEPLCTLLINDDSSLEQARGLVRDAFVIGAGPVSVPPLVTNIIRS